MQYLDLKTWIADNQPNEDLLWRESFLNQCRLLLAMKEVLRAEAYVISTHTSKSITLPVVCFIFNNGRMFFRDNFYDYKVTVLLRRSIQLDLEKYPLTDRNHNSLYFEGFPAYLVLPPYEDGCAAFSGQLDHYDYVLPFCTDLSR